MSALTSNSGRCDALSTGGQVEDSRSASSEGWRMPDNRPNRARAVEILGRGTAGRGTLLGDGPLADLLALGPEFFGTSRGDDQLANRLCSSATASRTASD